MVRLFRRAMLLAAVAASGCSSERDPNLPDLVPVSGTITLDGTPLSNTTISFMPAPGTPGTVAAGATTPDGKYTLKSMHSGAGAAVGQYRVIISKLKRPDGSDFPLDSPEGPIDAGADESLPPRYSDPEKTTLTANVPAGGGIIDFPLKSKP
jgi:hypothetical protein